MAEKSHYVPLSPQVMKIYLSSRDLKKTLMDEPVVILTSNCMAAFPSHFVMYEILCPKFTFL